MHTSGITGIPLNGIPFLVITVHHRNHQHDTNIVSITVWTERLTQAEIYRMLLTPLSLRALHTSTVQCSTQGAHKAETCSTQQGLVNSVTQMSQDDNNISLCHQQHHITLC